MTATNSQRVLVTGATGFVGSHVLRALLSRGLEVATLLRPGCDTWRIADVLPRVHRIEGDMMSLASARPALRAFRPHTVVHLAWAGVTAKHRDDNAQHDNVRATLELAQHCEESNCTAFIGLGSQAEYGLHERAIDEATPTEPRTNYGKAKLQTYTRVGAYCGERDMRFAWLRLFSAYGPMDHPQTLLSHVIEQLRQRRPVELTAGEQVWDYLYADDAAAAIADVATMPAAHGVFNLGSGRTQTLRRVVETVRDMIDPKLPLQFGARPYAPDQVMHLEANIARLKQATGWSPRIDLVDGLRRTLHWHFSREASHG